MYEAQLTSSPNGNSFGIKLYVSLLYELFDIIFVCCQYWPIVEVWFGLAFLTAHQHKKAISARSMIKL